MYPEFIAIYIGLGVLAVLQIITIILVLLTRKKLRRGAEHTAVTNRSTSARPSIPESRGVAFCTNCGAQFSAKIDVCPICGKPRS